jgi:hypothetical protein
MTNTNTITGRAAIVLAETLGLTLNKYADPTDDSETRAAGISVEVAREVVKQDPGLIWLDGAAVASAIGNEQIDALKTEATEHGDHDQVALCVLALDGSLWPDDHRGIGSSMAARLATMTQEQARVMCARAIVAAQTANV